MSRTPEFRDYAGVRTVVLAASGFIGRWVARALTEAGAELHLVVRSAPMGEPVLAAYGVRGTVHEQDLTDLAAVRQLLHRIQPVIVFNAAGYGVDPEEKQAGDERLAGLLNEQLPACAAEGLVTVPAPGWTGRRLVHLGSVYEYGNIGGHLEEHSVPAPTGLYGRSKLGGTRRLTQACETASLSGLTARICQIYGPGEHPGRLLPCLLEARGVTDSLILTAGTQKKDFTYAEDVAEGLLRLGVTVGPPGEVVNLATGRLTAVRDFALMAAHVLRLDPELLRFEKPLPDNELGHEELAVGRLRRLTGWTPGTTVAEGVRKTAEFLDRAGHR